MAAAAANAAAEAAVAAVDQQRNLLAGIIGQQEEMGMAAPTNEQLQNFNERMNQVPASFRATYPVAAKIRRYFERESIHEYNGCAGGKWTSPYKFLSSFRYVGGVNGALTLGQVNDLCSVVCMQIHGDPDDLEDKGRTKKEIYEEFYKAMKLVSKDMVGPAGWTYEQKLQAALSLELRLQLKTQTCTHLMIMQSEKKMQSMYDKVMSANKRFLLAEGHGAGDDAGGEKGGKKGKSYVCKSWLVGKCAGSCGDVHRAALGTICFLNDHFSLGLTDAQCIEKSKEKPKQ